MIGSQVGHYKILRQIGSGGMGEVYAAEDLTLNREVALKLLPPEMAADAERRERFDREAKVIAALDHPNIVTIHSVEQAAGPDGDFNFITMQLVDGQTLSELIPSDGFAVGRFFELAIPLAEAVSVAHEQGITHRDLKPGNVMVASDGRLKVLDFGLAKLAEEPEAAEPDMATEAATGYQAPADLTEEGKVLGTVAYMSPEQAEGKAVDHRSDIFSLGIILYQMASGEAPFRGDTKLSIMSSIVKEQPTSITDLNASLPRHLGRIIRKCLEKDPTRRYQTALSLRNDLEDLKGEFASGEALPIGAAGAGSAASRPPYALIAAAVVVTAIVAVVASQLLTDAPSRDTNNWGSSEQITFFPGVAENPSLEPGGERIVFASDKDGNLDVYERRVGGSTDRALTDDPADDYQPAYSRDGELIAFRADRDGGGIYVMGATGEDVRRLTDSGYYPSWSGDGSQIAYGTALFVVPWGLEAVRQIWVQNVDGGEPRLVIDEGVQPDWSPQGHRIAYFALSEGGQRDIFTIKPDGTGRVAVTNDEALDWSPEWSPDGRWLYFSSNRGGAGNIWRVRIDEETGAALAEPEPITVGGSDLQGYLSAADDSIAYAVVEYRSNIWRVEADPESGTVAGNPSPVTDGPRVIGSFDVSPDGALVALQNRFPQEDLLLIRSDGTDERNLTGDTFRDRGPSFSIDGESIFFYSDAGGDYEIWSIGTDGSDKQQITDDPEREFIQTVPFADGRMATFAEADSLIFDIRTPYAEQELNVLPAYEGSSGAFRFEPYDWSSDGATLVGTLVEAGGTARNHVGIYTIDTEEFEVFDTPGVGFAVWWDDERLLFNTAEGDLALLDIATDARQTILETAASRVDWAVWRPDDRQLYYAAASYRSDIHLLRASDDGQ